MAVAEGRRVLVAEEVGAVAPEAMGPAGEKVAVDAVSWGWGERVAVEELPEEEVEAWMAI